MKRKRSPKLLGFWPNTDQPEWYEGDLHIVVVGASGRGKSSRLFQPNILLDRNSVFCPTDVAAENSMVCGDARLKYGKLWIDNPHRIAQDAIGHLPHGGMNPMSILDLESLKFPIRSMKLASSCVVRDDSAKDKYWQNTARGSLKSGIMTEAIRGEQPNLIKVAEEVHGDFFKYAADICAQFTSLRDRASPGSWEIYQTLRRYVSAREDEVKSLKEVVEQLRTDTDFLLDEGVARNLTRNDYRPADSRQEVISVFDVLGIDVIEVLDKYLRLKLSTYLADLINPDVRGDVPVTIYCDEYGLVAKGGALEAMGPAFGAARKFNVSLFISVIDLPELQAAHQRDWHSILSSAGATIWMGPITELTTARYLSELCGEKEVYTPSVNAEGEGSFSRASRRVMTPSEIAALDNDQAIVFTEYSKGRPMLLRTKPWWQIPECKHLGRKNHYYD